MSHEISKTDKVLSVREPMWHGLEIRRDTAPTREEAEKLVHDWDVIREPLYRKVLHPDLTETYELLDTVELNVRSDTGTVLDAVNSDRVDVDPDEVWDVAETIMKQDSKIQIETAGSLREGRDIWILLKLDEIISIKGDYRGDSIAYFALQNSYVMGRGFRFQPTNVRIQCANTSSFADFNAEAAGLNLSLAHTQNLLERIEEIESKLQAWRTGIDEWKEAKEYLASLKVTTAQANWFVETYIDAPPDQLTSQRVKDNIEISRAELVFEYFNEYNDGVRGTALGLFEAASSWAGHVRKAASQESRFKRAMLTPDTVLQDAARLAKEASLV